MTGLTEPIRQRHEKLRQSNQEMPETFEDGRIVGSTLVLGRVGQCAVAVPAQVTCEVVKGFSREVVWLEAAPIVQAAEDADRVIASESMQRRLLAPLQSHVIMHACHWCFLPVSLRNNPIDHLERLVPCEGKAIQHIWAGLKGVFDTFDVHHRLTSERGEMRRVIGV